MIQLVVQQELRAPDLAAALANACILCLTTLRGLALLVWALSQKTRPRKSALSHNTCILEHVSCQLTTQCAQVRCMLCLRCTGGCLFDMRCPALDWATSPAMGLLAHDSCCCCHSRTRVFTHMGCALLACACLGAGKLSPGRRGSFGLSLLARDLYLLDVYPAVRCLGNGRVGGARLV
jgi:hypothetical protein